jgi:Ser/Thr protein kinase RdoA (MazF antagonist)
LDRDSAAQFNQHLLGEAEDRFGFVRGRSKPLESNRSLTYDCQRKRRRFILKVRPFGPRRTDSYTIGEFEFLEHLLAHGIRVPRALPSLDGQLVEVLDTECGPYMAYAYEKVPGQIIDWKEWSPELFQKWGELMGRLHGSSAVLVNEIETV